MMPQPTSLLAFISMPGGWEWIIILIIGLLIFGRRLPEIGRSIGKTIVEFKKGMASIDEEASNAVRPGAPVHSPQAGTLPSGQSAAQPSERRVSTHDQVEN